MRAQFGNALIILLFTSAVSCVDPLNLSVDGNVNTLVVDGLLTDENQIHTIKLSRNIPFDNTQALPAYFKPETSAHVVVEDDLGNILQFTETSAGVYSTDSLQGEIGRTYTLKITTANGHVYYSHPETMTASPAIDSISYRYEVWDKLYKNSSGNYVVVPQEGFRIEVLCTDPPETKNFYRWETNGIYEFFSITDNPYIFHCWVAVDRLEGSVVVSNDVLKEGSTINEFLCHVIYDRPTRYLVNVRQYSLSEGAYNFWQKVESQQLNTGTMFDPVPSPISGNVYNTDDPDENVLGYFGASAVSKKYVVFDRLKVAKYGPANAIPMEFGDCRTHVPGATTVKPEGF